MNLDPIAQATLVRDAAGCDNLLTVDGRCWQLTRSGWWHRGEPETRPEVLAVLCARRGFLLDECPPSGVRRPMWLVADVRP